MKKKVLLFLLIVVTMISTIQVNADEAWPKSFTYGDYQYSVEGVILNLYEITETEDNDGETTRSSINFLHDEPTRTIDISAEGYTINPEYKERKVGYSDGLIIDINLNITKEQIEALLQNELTNDNKEYLVELAVKYKFTQMPDIYTHTYKVNILKSLMNLFVENSSNDLNLINMKETNYQVLDLMSIERTDTGKKLDVDLNPTRESSYATGSINYQALFKNAVTSSEETPAYVIMFTNNDNVDNILDALIAIEEEEKQELASNSNKNDDKQVVKVDDTSLSTQIYLYTISLIALLLGSILIIITIEQQKHNEKQQ